MAVIINFSVNGAVVNESNPLDFGTVQAGTSSGIQTVSVSNSGSSDALMCTIDPIASLASNGFETDTWIGTAQETYLAQQFANDIASPYYGYGVVGVGKNYTNKTGGTLANTSGVDTFATKWLPPSTGNSGAKVWGCRFSCVYI